MTNTQKPKFQAISKVTDKDDDDVASDEAIEAIAKKRDIPSLTKPSDENKTGAQYRRTSVSLFPIDQDAIDGIAEIVKSKCGVRNIPDSLCVRIALRAITDDHDLIGEIYKKVKDEDLRRKNNGIIR